MTLDLQKWRGLRAYERIARGLGWLLVVLSAVSLMAIAALIFKDIPFQGHVSEALWELFFIVFLPGALLLATSQFLHWISAEEEMQWLLRKTPLILTIAAAIYSLQLGQVMWRIPHVLSSVDGIKATYFISVDLIVNAAPPVILLVVAQLLRKVQQIIAESKLTV